MNEKQDVQAEEVEAPDSVVQSDPREEAKRLVVSHNFGPLPQDNSDERRLRRNVRTRGGYARPKDLALAAVDMYHMDKETDRTPEVIAASAVYFARIMFDQRSTQLEIANEYDVSPSSIQAAYQPMIDRFNR